MQPTPVTVPLDLRGQVPRRVVSLVPSDTYNLAALGALDRLVGRTRFCIEPPEAKRAPEVGGTKNVRIEQVLALQPDLVLANQEENSRKDVLALLEKGLSVLVGFPRTVREGLECLERLSVLLQLEPQGPVDELLEEARLMRTVPFPKPAPVRCFVPIWPKPWMSLNGATYIGDVLRFLGLRNIFEEEPSMHPQSGTDNRYPQVTLEQVVEMQPQLVLLPDEPYPFGQKHIELFQALDIPAARSGAIVCISGKDLCWHGAWAVAGLRRLAKQIAPWVQGASN